ncbi:hypothetical protein CFAM422_011699 [Trichoderma lentiforme]|uniref:Uncharacterized protein n=1 Tax=Trichoderma lentiforme TaxID=1567552 RepID=A0A9P4X5C3_9HYPO|nr:hypothetical protein CFAM422_011699 [Trichoderma lentiforme]
MSKQFDDQVLEELGLDPNAGRRLSTACIRPYEYPPEAAPYLAGPPPLAPSHSDVGTPAAHSSPRDYAP